MELSTGSLGHGIGVAAGMALGFKLSGSSRRVFVLIGDGESNEGTVWESAMVAANLHLDNLTVLFDNNRSQARCLPVDEARKKIRRLRFRRVTVDGHDLSALKEAVRDPAAGRPRAVIAHTVKGKGLPHTRRGGVRLAPAKPEVR